MSEINTFFHRINGLFTILVTNRDGALICKGMSCKKI